MRIEAGARLLVPAVLLAVAGVPEAKAQVAGNTVVPAPEPSASASPLPVPPAPVIELPTPTPAALRPRATAAPRPTSTPSPRANASPAPRSTPAAAPDAVPSPRSSPSPVATDRPAPAPTATPGPTVPATPAPLAATADGQGSGRAAYWPIALAATVLALLAVGWAVLRRRRTEPAPLVEEAASFEDRPAPPPAAASLPRARLAIAFRPIRAGLNLLSATSENEIVVTNTGDAPAEDIRLATRLVSAHAGQDADLAALHAAPIGRPMVPAFTLDPGEQRVVTGIAALPREAIRPLSAAGRPMFVPIVAVNLTYRTAGDTGQLAQAFAIGVERVDSAKLAPFWLDAPPRTFDQVAARPHAATVER